LSSPHLKASPATTFHACSSPAPTPVKPQPAPAILSQESVHKRCQSLITQGSDHPPVIEPHMVLTRPAKRIKQCLRFVRRHCCSRAPLPVCAHAHNTVALDRLCTGCLLRHRAAARMTLCVRCTDAKNHRSSMPSSTKPRTLALGL
jgi:hypothetical protein